MRIFGKMMLAALSAICLFASDAYAQAPAKKETKQYEKALKKGTVKEYDAFLKKYPQSVYAQNVTHLRDSLVFFACDMEDPVAMENFLSDYPKSDFCPSAESVLECLNTPEAALDLFAEGVRQHLGLDISDDATVIYQFRRRGVEKAMVMNFSDSEAGYMLSVLSIDENGECGLEVQQRQQYYTMDKGERRYLPDGDVCIKRIRGEEFFVYSYRSCSADPHRLDKEYVANLLSLDCQNIESALFYGRQIGSVIEGRSPEALSQGALSPQQAFLRTMISENETLREIAEEDALSDDSIDWWIANNPMAYTTAKSLKFGKLPQESSLVQTYLKAKKESGQGYSAACFDFRGYTVIVGYNRSSSEYSLVWVEPVCRNRKTDAYINSIYFQSGSANLNLFYYKGKKTYKNYINLSSKTLKRS